MTFEQWCMTRGVEIQNENDRAAEAWRAAAMECYRLASMKADHYFSKNFKEEGRIALEIASMCEGVTR